jgi:hypothetical protein
MAEDPDILYVTHPAIKERIAKIEAGLRMFGPYRKTNRSTHPEIRKPLKGYLGKGGRARNRA